MSNRKKNKELKVIQGTFRKHREKSGAALCIDDKIPSPPSFLDTEALKEWHRVAPLLFEAGLLSSLDKTALSGYCVAWSRFLAAEKQLEGQEMLISSPTGNLSPNPLIRISRQAQEQFLSAAKLFGITPASRSKVVPKKLKAKDAWKDF